MAWFTAPSGAACVAAYDAVGASSLADSYTNKANPGTYDAAPGTAPTWAYGTGWIFNGTTQYLTTGITPTSASWSMIIRYSGVAGAAAAMLIGVIDDGNAPTNRFYLRPWHTASTVIYGAGSAVQVAPQLAAGVLCVAGRQGYRNGVAEGGLATSSAAALPALLIGCTNTTTNPGGPTSFQAANIQALAIYSGTLTAADVLAITTALNALPAAAAAKGLPVIAHHYRQIFGG